MEQEEGNTRVVHKYWEQCWNLHEPDGLDSTHAIAFAQNGVAIGVPKFKEGLASFFQSFPDISISIEDIMAKDDKVLMRVHYRGTHLGDYCGIPATGRTISLGGLELFLLIDGKIVSHWHEMDHLAILQQIGATAIVPQS